MGKKNRVSIVDRRALNQMMIYAARAPLKTLIPAMAMARALRSALRMTQAQLAKRSGVPRAHIARLEAGIVDPQWETLRRLFDAMFCDLFILPRPRKRPGDALAEWELDNPGARRIWDE